MIQNHRLIIPYAAPYLIYVTIATILGGRLSSEINYILRIILVLIALVWAWRCYSPIKGPYSPLISVIVGIPAGILGFTLWVLFLHPFVHSGNASAWSNNAFVLRLIAAGVLVPIFEEILMRGFIFRFVLQWDYLRRQGVNDPLAVTLNEKSVNDVNEGAWSWAAILISTLVFTLGHNMVEWPSSIVYGLLMAFLWIVRKDLLTCITAHAVTNITLAFYVFNTGNWQYW